MPSTGGPFVSIRENDWAGHAYQQARARGQHHNRALRGIGARWTRILWRAWTDHTIYDPALHLKKPTPSPITSQASGTNFLPSAITRSPTA